MSASPKSHLSETDICDRFITPALEQAGWTLEQHILREYTLRPGRLVVRGQASHRDKASMLRADYACCSTSPTCRWLAARQPRFGLGPRR